MKFREITNGLYKATRSNINVYAIKSGGGVTLIDCGEPDFAADILSACDELGQIKSIIVTHAHRDHSGSLAEIAKSTGAPVWMHEADAKLISRGAWIRPYRHAGTPLSWLLGAVIVKRYPATVPIWSKFEIAEDQATIDVAGGLKVHHMPGHSAGQIALQWTNAENQTVLIAGDTCMNVLGLTQPILYEDRRVGIESIGRLAKLAENADWAVFGHGPSLRSPGPKLRRFYQKLASSEG